MNLLDPEFVKWLATLGVGGILGGMMFLFYRKDSRQQIEQWRGQSQLLMKVVQENSASITANSQILASTNVMIDLLIRRLERRGGELEDGHHQRLR